MGRVPHGTAIAAAAPSPSSLWWAPIPSTAAAAAKLR